MNEMGEKYLAVGTVVMLKGATKRLVITGFCGMENEKKEKMWDYSGCMYPEGFLNTNQVALFDHSQIEKICHLGLVDDPEEKEFKIKMKDYLANIKTMASAMDKPIETKTETLAIPEVEIMELPKTNEVIDQV